MPSMSLGVESLKKWVDYWRKFKGKGVRIWLGKLGPRDAAHHFCLQRKLGENLEHRLERDELFRNMRWSDLLWQSSQIGQIREVGICPCVEGKIIDVIDSPFGMMLGNVCFWLDLELSTKTHQNPKVGKVSTEIESMFIPMSEIARVDFLKKRRPK